MRKIVFAIVVFLAMVAPVRAELLSASDAAMVKRVDTNANLTQPTGEAQNKLEKVLTDNPVGELNWHNFLRFAINRAVNNGVPVNTVVLILLFPLIVALVTAARHLIGIRGAGILTPALLSVAFLATGIWAGVALFVVILFVTVAGRAALTHFKLQYLPRVSLLLWVVSGAVFLTLFLSSIWSISQLVTVGIFPILILILLAETFIDIQQGRSGGEARTLIFQTFSVAMISSLLLGWDVVQKAVLLWPEAIFFGVAVFDLFMGRYTGLRLTEYLMYRGVAKEDEEE
jgi:hypothetical protein